ncbi:GntR family transcriptional regulator [Yoonia litorea]|uniref:Transcriptional regulator, GntR family n=1 Tax=Yoonia litorea TaxID=1123755 RepID=A0A1I6L4A1_9RHOB|nr:GntR family transcriptional regulator [Yoonia litorea]SFR98315.1 transcriptional regulator, GntR family [Yoonia litorea]
MTDGAQAMTATETATFELRELIFAGDLAPGSNHLEGELAARLGMSRTPVREAMMLLQQQGLVTVQPRRGMRVLPISVKDMEEIYELLTVLESAAAAGAAARQPDEMALSPLTQAIADMDHALADEDLIAWARADDAFHAALVALSGNQRLVRVTEQIVDQVRRARRITLYLRPLPVKSNDDHWRVLEAIRAGDAETAHAVHRAHRQETKVMLIGILKKNQLRQL